METQEEAQKSKLDTGTGGCVSESGDRCLVDGLVDGEEELELQRSLKLFLEGKGGAGMV